MFDEILHVFLPFTIEGPKDIRSMLAAERQPDSGEKIAITLDGQKSALDNIYIKCF